MRWYERLFSSIPAKWVFSNSPRHTSHFFVCISNPRDPEDIFLIQRPTSQRLHSWARAHAYKKPDAGPAPVVAKNAPVYMLIEMRESDKHLRHTTFWDRYGPIPIFFANDQKCSCVTEIEFMVCACLDLPYYLSPTINGRPTPKTWLFWEM